MTVEIMRTDKSACDLRRDAAACRDAKAARRMLAIALILWTALTARRRPRTAGWTARRCVTGYTVTMTRGLRVSRTGVRQDGSPCSAWHRRRSWHRLCVRGRIQKRTAWCAGGALTSSARLRSTLALSCMSGPLANNW